MDTNSTQTADTGTTTTDTTTQTHATTGATTAAPSLDLRSYMDDRGGFVKDGWSKAFGLPDTIEAKFKTFDGLAKSYVNLEKMLGSQNRVPVPNEHSAPEEWEAFFQKTGRPNKPEEYELKVDDNLKAAGIDEKMLGEYQGMAHKLGLSKKQMAELTAFHFGKVGAQLTEAQGAQAKAMEAGVAALKQEWGAAYEQNLAMAERGAAAAGLTPDVLKTTPELSNNPHFIKAMAKVAQMTAEQSGAAGMRNNGGSLGFNTPEAAKVEIGRIRGDKNHPYNNTSAPQMARDAAVAAMAKLYETAYPEQR